jgi:hypothetical protein
VEVLDATEKEVAVAEIAILQGGVDNGRTIAKLTKPIRYLGRRGFKDLFKEGEPLPATKAEICYRAGKANLVRIPIYQGDRPLSELTINDVGPEVKVGAEIRLTVTIERDYSVRSEAVICESGQKVTVDFRIEQIKMPSLEELQRDKDATMEEIENGLGVVKDPNKLAQFRRAARRLEAEFDKARKSNEPDAHHLFTLVGELRKILAEIANSEEFLNPPLEEFQGMMRVCRSLAGKMKPNAAVSKEEILEKVSALEAAGKSAWEKQDKREWELVNKEGRELKQSLEPNDGGTDLSKIAPEVLQRSMLAWLDEIAGDVEKRKLQSQFGKSIEDLRDAIRGVSLKDSDAARDQLLQILEEKLRPLSARLKDAGVESAEGQLMDW